MYLSTNGSTIGLASPCRNGTIYQNDVTMALYMRTHHIHGISCSEKLAKTRRRGFIFGFATIFLMLVLVLGATCVLGRGFVSSKTPVIPANILAGTNSLAGSPYIFDSWFGQFNHVCDTGNKLDL